ncbi:uncharacterized protein [Aristolochia californica]|uniref:uncharacterized protein isoform X2 n=1 Tax=Aristolochia californica TaxID=171875 RepID=UPI0035E26580
MKDVIGSSSSLDSSDVHSGAEAASGSKWIRSTRKNVASPSTSTDASGAVKASEPVEEKRLKRMRRGYCVTSANEQETLESTGNITTSEQAKARLSPTQMNATRSSSPKKQITGHNEYPGKNIKNELPQAEFKKDNLALEIENDNLDKKTENKKLEQNSGIQKNKNLKQHVAVKNKKDLKQRGAPKEKNLGQKIEYESPELYIENKSTMMQIHSVLQDAFVGVTKEESQEKASVSGSVTKEDKEKPFNIQSVCEIFTKELVQGTVDNSIYVQKDDNLSKVTIPSQRNSHSRKLLILDLNGLLVDIVASVPVGRKPDKRMNHKAVFKRPFCDDFLKFCFDRFDMAVWSSRRKDNMKTVVDFLMADLKHKLLFCWVLEVIFKFT